MEGRKERVKKVAKTVLVYAGGMYIWFLLLASTVILDGGKYPKWMIGATFLAIEVYSVYSYMEGVGFMREHVSELSKYIPVAISIFVMLLVSFSLILLIAISRAEGYPTAQLAFFLGLILYLLYYGKKLMTYCKERKLRKMNR